MSAPCSPGTGTGQTAAIWNATTANSRTPSTSSRGVAGRCSSTTRYLADVGLFDERLFLYYEDVELAWRGLERGWRHRYVPDSVVRHVHAASTVEGSPLFDFYNERNRLLTLTRHADRRMLVKALARYFLVTGSYPRRDIVSPALRGQAPHPRILLRRLRAFGAYLWVAFGPRGRQR